MDNIPSGEQETKLDIHTEELLEKIKAEKITIHPTVWELMNHTLGNRIYALELLVGEFADNPKWLFKVASFVMVFLYKISGGSGKPSPILHYIERIQANVEQMNTFIRRLRVATEKKGGF